jgi:hypothetical protein
MWKASSVSYKKLAVEGDFNRLSTNVAQAVLASTGSYRGPVDVLVEVVEENAYIPAQRARIIRINTIDVVEHPHPAFFDLDGDFGVDVGCVRCGTFAALGV